MLYLFIRLVFYMKKTDTQAAMAQSEKHVTEARMFPGSSLGHSILWGKIQDLVQGLK